MTLKEIREPLELGSFSPTLCRKMFFWTAKCFVFLPPYPNFSVKQFRTPSFSADRGLKLLLALAFTAKPALKSNAAALLRYLFFPPLGIHHVAVNQSYQLPSK